MKFFNKLLYNIPFWVAYCITFMMLHILSIIMNIGYNWISMMYVFILALTVAGFMNLRDRERNANRQT